MEYIDKKIHCSFVVASMKVVVASMKVIDAHHAAILKKNIFCGFCEFQSLHFVTVISSVFIDAQIFRKNSGHRNGC